MYVRIDGYALTQVHGVVLRLLCRPFPVRILGSVTSFPRVRCELLGTVLTHFSQRYPSIPAPKQTRTQPLEEAGQHSSETGEGTAANSGNGGERRESEAKSMEAGATCAQVPGGGGSGSRKGSGDGSADERVLFAFDGMCLPLMRGPLKRVFRCDCFNVPCCCVCGCGARHIYSSNHNSQRSAAGTLPGGCTAVHGRLTLAMPRSMSSEISQRLSADLRVDKDSEETREGPLCPSSEAQQDTRSRGCAARGMFW